MIIKNALKSAFNSVWAHKVRSLLTISGVIVGVFSVVTLVSLVKGLENFVVEEFESLGSNLVFIYPGSGGIFDDPALAFFNNKFSARHVELLNQEAADIVKTVEPLYQTGSIVTHRAKNYSAAILGGNADLQRLYNLPISGGRLMTAAETKTNAPVAVIGHVVKEELFGTADPIGKNISIEGKSFEVVGYLEKKNPDYDLAVVIPLKSVEELFNLKNYTYILAELYEPEDITIKTKILEAALLRDLTRDDFTIYTSDDLLGVVGEILDILKYGLAAVAGISLIVGGIGIMNIMLVAVSERTREIGLRKALGATRFDIGLQFLMESSFLSLLGGLSGLSLGLGACLIAQNWINAEVTPGMILLSLGFSMFVGILFGTYPALQAGKLDPIEALRYE